VTDAKDQSIQTLAHYEEIAHKGLSDAWGALVIIRNKTLYKQLNYATFAEYINCTFDYSLREVQRQLSHNEICTLLEDKTGTSPDKVSHSRELTSLSNEKKVEVWEQVQERAVETHEPVTASLIKEVKAGSSVVPVKKHTFTKTFARVVHDYREATSVSDEEREKLRTMIVALLEEIDSDSRIVEAA
jgi:hypothetical protein